MNQIRSPMQQHYNSQTPNLGRRRPQVQNSSISLLGRIWPIVGAMLGDLGVIFRGLGALLGGLRKSQTQVFIMRAAEAGGFPVSLKARFQSNFRIPRLHPGNSPTNRKIHIPYTSPTKFSHRNLEK